jgi:cell wall-associated NlpC family hydrolase
MSWPGHTYGVPVRAGRGDLVGRAVPVGGVLATAALLVVVLVGVFVGSTGAEDPAADPGTLPSSAVARRTAADRSDDTGTGATGTGATGTGADGTGGAGTGGGSTRAGAGADFAAEGSSGPDGWEWESGWDSDDGSGDQRGPGTADQGGPAPDDQRGTGSGRRGDGPVTCTKEITDLAELHAAMVSSGPDEIICVRGPLTMPAVSAAVAFARSQLGEAYRWGGNSRADGGFDCSGLTSAAYASAGVPIPRTAQAQYNAGPRLSADQQIKAGDLVFFGSGPRSVGHVGLAVSSTAMINAPDVGQAVTVGPIRRRDFVGASRPTSPTTN